MPKAKSRSKLHRKVPTTKVTKSPRRSWLSRHPLRTGAIIVVLGALLFGWSRMSGGLTSLFGVEPAGINVTTTAKLLCSEFDQASCGTIPASNGCRWEQGPGVRTTVTVDCKEGSQNCNCKTTGGKAGSPAGCYVDGYYVSGFRNKEFCKAEGGNWQNAGRATPGKTECTKQDTVVEPGAYSCVGNINIVPRKLPGEADKPNNTVSLPAPKTQTPVVTGDTYVDKSLNEFDCKERGGVWNRSKGCTLEFKGNAVACCTSTSNSTSCKSLSGLNGSLFEFKGVAYAGQSCPKGQFACPSTFKANGQLMPGTSACNYARGGGGFNSPPAVERDWKVACQKANPGLAIVLPAECGSGCNASYVQVESARVCTKSWKGICYWNPKLACYSTPSSIQTAAIDICKSVPLNTTLNTISELSVDGVVMTSATIQGGNISLTTGTLETSGEPNTSSGVSCKPLKSADCLNKIGKGVKDQKGNDVTFVHEACPYLGSNGSTYTYSQGTCCPNN